MSAQPALDTAPLSWVRGEIGQELALARQYLEQFAFNPGDTSHLRFARSHLHQVTGAARMLELDGLAQVCEEIEAVIAALEERSLPAQPAGFQLLNRALAAVAQFVDGVARGEPNAPLRLYPLYRELAQARGGSAAESDLFFPPLDVAPPAGEFREMDPAELALLVRGERARFQKALLTWLRTGDSASLAEMSRAVGSLELVQERAEGRTYWWPARTFFDALT